MLWTGSLFEEDRFSNFEMDWTIVNQASILGQRIKEFLSYNYPHLSHNETVYKISGQGTINSANVLVETQTVEVVIKMLSLKQRKKAEYLKMVNAELPDSFIFAPRLIRNQSGDFVTKHSDGIFLLYEKLGEVHYSGKFPEFKNFLYVFERFTELNITNISNFETQPLISLDCRKTLDGFLSLAKGKKSLASYREMLLTKHLVVLEKIDTVLSALEDSHFHQLRPLHIDLHPQNLSMKNGELFFLDLEAIHLSSISRSLGFAVYKLIRQSVASGESIQRFSTLLKSKEFKRYLEHNNCTLGDLKNAATQEVLRRLFILVELLKKGDFEWDFVLPMHLNGLLEIDQIFAA
jgi:hypothetical protein